MLAHASAAMTLDTYGHLLEGRLDKVGNAIDLARRASLERRSCCSSVAKPSKARNGEEALSRVPAGRACFSDLYPRRDSNPRYRLERAAC